MRRSAGLGVLGSRTFDVIDQFTKGFAILGHVAVPKKTFNSLKLRKDFLLRDAGAILANTAGRLRELLDSLRDVKSVENVFRICRTSCKRRFGFWSTRRTRANTLASPSCGILLQASTSKQFVAPGRALPTSNVAAVKSDGDRRARLWSGLNFLLTEIGVVMFFGPEFVFHRSAGANKCWRTVSACRSTSTGSTSCNRSATAANDRCAAHFDCRKSSSGAVCVVSVAVSGLKVAFVGFPSQPHACGLRSAMSPKAVRKRRGWYPLRLSSSGEQPFLGSVRCTT